MCSLRRPRREWVSGSGREAEGCLPRPAGSPGPNTALMRATGTDGHTQGARDYCAGPRGAGERDPRRGAEESPIGSPAADLCPCSHSASMYWCFLLMMLHVWNICRNLPVGMCVPHVLYILHVCMMLVYPIRLKILSAKREFLSMYFKTISSYLFHDACRFMKWVLLQLKLFWPFCQLSGVLSRTQGRKTEIRAWSPRKDPSGCSRD